MIARATCSMPASRVEAIGDRSVTIASLADGTVHALPLGDRMLERLDLAYALNVHVAQGVTTDHGIIVMSAGERRLASARTFLVAVTRIADKATLVVDSGRNLERAVTRNPGEKTAALEVAARLPERAIPGPEEGGRTRDFSLGM